MYGSLRAGFALPDQPDLAGRLLAVGACVLEGVLYDLGDYPGLIPAQGRVVGELYELLDPAVLAVLDSYEQYDASRPSRSEYVRRVTQLVHPDVDAWVYYFNGEIRGFMPVPSGDWAGHMRSRDKERPQRGATQRLY